MAEYVRGYITISGEDKNIERFLSEGLEIFKENTDRYFVNGTKRQFIFITKKDKEDKNLRRFFFEGAWEVDIEGFENASKEYKVDFKFETVTFDGEIINGKKKVLTGRELHKFLFGK